MPGMRWKLLDLVLLVFAAAVVFAAYRYFWKGPPDPNERFYLSAYVALLAAASLAAFFARPRWRRWFQGFALSAWFNLVFVMWGGFGIVTYVDAERVAEGSQMGVIFSVVAALASGCLLEPPDA